MLSSCRPVEESFIYYCIQMSKLLHGEMKCTAPAHLLSKHQQRDISCSALQKKGKAKRLLNLWKLDCENIFCNLNRRRDQSTASAHFPPPGVRDLNMNMPIHKLLAAPRPFQRPRPSNRRRGQLDLDRPDQSSSGLLDEHARNSRTAEPRQPPSLS
ncbi:hypothetical protein SORBI_3001G477500 [Sorghum bicolor]|uniref:Uncharacterized protein n=1 Tax=Sorghum bicolor TaxID=4558 RepID=A0A1B6QQ18_SORBI|nr:hypothetical protein SORBI_3001G477500 [Sorghum bicolor]